MSAVTKTKEVLFSQYGHLIRAENPEFDSERGVYVSSLMSNYPIMIKDDKNQRRFIRRIKVPYLGNITLDEKLRPVINETTEYSEVNQRLEKFLQIWTDQAEKLVMKTTADLLVRLPEIQMPLSPLRVIINRMWRRGKFEDEEMDIARPRAKATRHRKYLRLLQEIDLVKREDDVWVPGDDFLKVRTKIRSQREGREKLLAIVLRKGYAVLRQAFDIGNFERVMKVENIIYLHETEENRQIFRDVRTVETDLRRFYRDKVNPMDTESTLVDLSEIGAIIQEDDFFAGREHIRSDIITEKTMQPSLESQWLASFA